MTAAGLDHLLEVYAETDDPWSFRTSAYEAERLDAIAASLPRATYTAALEIGCGNGELGRRIAPRCVSYTGLDAVPLALTAARRALPGARLVRAFLPCALPAAPGGAYDLIVLSEVLYFLDPDAVRDLAATIDRDHPSADMAVSVWRGPTGHMLGGDEALDIFADATPRGRRTARLTEGYRIALFAPLAGGAT